MSPIRATFLFSFLRNILPGNLYSPKGAKPARRAPCISVTLQVWGMPAPTVLSEGSYPSPYTSLLRA